MAEFKLVIGTKTGKCAKREVKETQADVFLGKRLGDTVKGDTFDLGGYEFLITGGSDTCGFPMRKDVEGTARKRLLIISGPNTLGAKKRMKSRGCRQKKSVAGNTIFEKTAQINLKLLKGDEKALLVVQAAPEGEEKKG